MNLLLFILTGLKILINHLYLSIRSIDFYKDVYNKYHGYGIRYLFVVSFIPSIIYCIFILSYIVTLKDYFNRLHSSKVTDNIEYILNQVPEIKYANSKIFIEEPEPFYLYNKHNEKVVVIDTKNQISNVEKSKIPFVLEASKFTVNLMVANTKKSFPSIKNYSDLFKKNQLILTPEIIKKYCAENLLHVPNLFIYFGMPTIILFWFITFLFEKSVIILLIYITTSLLRIKTSIQTATRLVMFSSGVPILLQPIITLIPQLSEVSQLIQIFTLWLVFAAIWQIHKNREFSSYL